MKRKCFKGYLEVKGWLARMGCYVEPGPLAMGVMFGSWSGGLCLVRASVMMDGRICVSGVVRGRDPYGCIACRRRDKLTLYCGSLVSLGWRDYRTLYAPGKLFEWLDGGCRLFTAEELARELCRAGYRRLYEWLFRWVYRAGREPDCPAFTEWLLDVSV